MLSRPEMSNLLLMKYEELRRLVARRILRLREVRGWSQRELAQRAGISQRTVSNYEALDAQTDSGNLGGLSKVATVFGLEVWELVKPETEEEGKKAASVSAGADGLAPDAIKFARAVQNLPASQRAALEQTIKAFADLAASPAPRP